VCLLVYLSAGTFFIWYEIRSVRRMMRPVALVNAADKLHDPETASLRAGLANRVVFSFFSPFTLCDKVHSRSQAMKRWLNDLDRILRGEATRLGTLREDGLKLPLGGLLLVILLLTVWYGACMGFFAGFREGGPYYKQWCADIVKVPSLFFLTMAVTFPSLYVFNALVGSRLTFAAIFKLLVASLVVNVTVLASLGPIVAFFSVSTTSYPFIMLLNVVVFVVSGVLGFTFMLQTLYRLSAAQQASLPPNDPPHDCGYEPRPVEEKGALWGVRSHALDPNVRSVFVWWMMVFGVVLAQMAWVLRPLLGNPVEPFQWFCARQSNFFQAVWDAIRNLLS
jgi:hypothetical protein